MPEPKTSPTAVIVAGGKQYRVTAGDRILVDRLDSEPGTEFAVERVLLFADGDEVKVGGEAAGVEVKGKVVRHEKGPRVLAFRYKSKKHVRVHRGSRAALTAVEIIQVGSKPAKREPAKAAARAEVPSEKKPTRSRAAASPTRKAAAPARARKTTKKESGNGA